MPTEATLRLTRHVRRDHATHRLTPPQARLYSHSLRLSMKQPGLRTYSSGEALARLDEAVMLIECALIERSADQSQSWRGGVKRAAEILEWLSQQEVRRTLNSASEPSTSASEGRDIPIP